MGKSNYLELVGFLLLPILVVCCVGQKTKQDEVDDILRRMTKLPAVEYNADDHDMFFIAFPDGKAYLSSGFYLHRFYKDELSGIYEDYDLFKEKIIAQDFDPESLRRFFNDNTLFKYYEIEFELDESVQSFFDSHSLGQFVDYYCKKTGNNMLTYKKKFFDKRMTIAYCLWTEGYDYNYDDYLAEEWYCLRKKD